MEEKQKKLSAKRIQLLDVVLERKGVRCFQEDEFDRQRMQPASSVISLGKRQWLEKVQLQRNKISVSISIQSIDFLVAKDIPVTYLTLGRFRIF